uniref:Uncharacterized protein n=1 Tax=Tanacetum cinerariifolium TaxID=118510 RepID=A0A6L2P610_TANCI|nr:hypothetical protein [Tanacetum cinerariifolium]
MLVREKKTTVGLYQTKGMIKVYRIKATHLEMQAAGQGMNAMTKALLGMIRTSDLSMTQNQWLSNTCVVEKVDSNVIPDSPNMCDNDIQINQNVVECDDERVVLASLIANLKLDVDENKKI